MQIGGAGGGVGSCTGSQAVMHCRAVGIEGPWVWRKCIKCEISRVHWTVGWRRWPGKGVRLISKTGVAAGSVIGRARASLGTEDTHSASHVVDVSGSVNETATEFNGVVILQSPQLLAIPTENQMPLKVTSGLTVENLGSLYHGPDEDKYWSESRCGHRHPYPVGYTATKTYKGLKFRQSIRQGAGGPEFVVGEVGKGVHSADSPVKAWALALVNSQLDANTRIHGRKHFGLDCPKVLELLSAMTKNLPTDGAGQGVVVNEKKERKRPQKKTEVEHPGKLEGRSNQSLRCVQEEDITTIRDTNVKLNQSVSKSAHHSGHTQNDGLIAHPENRKQEASNRRTKEGASAGLIRLRTEWLVDSSLAKVHIASCLGEDKTFVTLPANFKEVLQQGQPGKTCYEGGKENVQVETADSENLTAVSMRKLPNEKLESDRTQISLLKPSNASSPLSNQRATTTDPNTNPSSRRKNTMVKGEGYDDSLEASAGIVEGSERTSDGRFSRGDGLEQRDSLTRLFQPTVHRSRISLEDSASKDLRRSATGGSRSLVNILEDWNKGVRSQSILSGTPIVGNSFEKTQQALDLLSLKSRTNGNATFFRMDNMKANGAPHGSGVQLDSPNSLPNTKNRGWLKDWESGKDGRALVLEEIRQLVVNNHVQKALDLVKDLKTNGAHIDDTVYSMFFPFVFDDWQKQAIEQMKEKSVLICAPGGAGKSVTAAHCLYEAFVKNERSIFVTPFEALEKEHLMQFQMIFGMENVSNLAAGVKSRLPITVTTLKTLIKELREGICSTGSEGRSSFVGTSLLVMDGFHTLGDVKYGSLWEEAVMLLDQQVKLVALSLPLQNPQDVVSWISSIHKPCELIVCELEPVPKSYYFCDLSGLHLVAKSDCRDMSISWTHKSKVSMTTHSNESMNDIEPSLRCLLQSQESEKLFPMAISFLQMEDCIDSMNSMSEIIAGAHMSRTELNLIEDRLKKFFMENAHIERQVNKDTIKCLLQGCTLYHEGQLSLWLEFVRGLIHDNLMKIVFATDAMLCRSSISVRTMVYSSMARSFDFGEASELSRSNLVQLSGTAGRRGLDSTGNVVFVGSSLCGLKEAKTMTSMTTMSIKSNFQPSYSLLLSLLSKHTLLEVQAIVESNFADCLAKKKMSKANTLKLQESSMFTQVDVRVEGCGHLSTHGFMPGVLFAVVPGPTEHLYMILCADNNFRLLPACALEHVYSKEPRLDAAYRTNTGFALHAPPLPPKETWKVLPAKYLAYISKGTRESASIVEILGKHGLKVTEREGIGRAATIVWTRSEQMIHTLRKADAFASPPLAQSCAKLNPLGILISRLHDAENELWLAIALTSSIVKPLTAPELASICSAFVFKSKHCRSEVSEPGAGIHGQSMFAPEAPAKRLRAALEKLEKLRQEVAALQGSDIPALRLNGSAVAMVHARVRETVLQSETDPIGRHDLVLVLRQTVDLLHLVDNVWSRSTEELSALGFTSGLHNLPRKAAHLIQNV